MYPLIKRLLDFLLAASALLLLSPLLLLVVLIIKLHDNGSVFFSQQRVGRYGHLFTLFKFRTMTEQARDAAQQVFQQSADVTKPGYWLRRFKIDELPQLFNVLTGDLSLIGPRPCLPQTLDEFGEDAAIRHSVRPGLTGLAQVNGNIHLSWQQRLAFDLRYVKQLSFMLDVKILLRTVAVVMFGEQWGKKS